MLDGGMLQHTERPSTMALAGASVDVQHTVGCKVCKADVILGLQLGFGVYLQSASICSNRRFTQKR